MKKKKIPNKANKKLSNEEVQKILLDNFDSYIFVTNKSGLYTTIINGTATELKNLILGASYEVAKKALVTG